MKIIYKVVIAICMSLALLPISYARPGVVRPGGVGKQQGKQFRANKRTTVNQVNKGSVRPGNVSGKFLERLQDNQKNEAKKAFDSVMVALSQPVNAKRVSSEEVSEAVKVLNKKVPMDEKTLHNLQKATSGHKYIASAVVNLAKNQASVSKGEVLTALRFVSQMYEVNPVAANVVGSGEAALLAISSRVDEIVANWSGVEKTNVMALMKTYMRMIPLSVGPAAALNATLRARGYDTVEQMQKRVNDITKACKKAA